MLSDPPLLRIKKTLPRIDPGLLERFRGCQTGWLVDAQFGRGALDPTIKPLFATDPARNHCVGTAITCGCGPDDNLALGAALGLSKPGDILVASYEGFGSSALIGDIMAGMARNRGITAIVTDAPVRDLVGLREVGLTVFCTGLTPNSPVRNGPGTVGLPIQIGGRQVATGDLIVADEDGVVSAPHAELKAILERVNAIKMAEAEVIVKVREGMDTPGHVEALLSGDRIEWLD
ncbi:MAG: RraA family protein [Pseudomonadota bacterium]